MGLADAAKTAKGEHAAPMNPDAGASSVVTNSTWRSMPPPLMCPLPGAVAAAVSVTA